MLAVTTAFALAVASSGCASMLAVEASSAPSARSAHTLRDQRPPMSHDLFASPARNVAGR
jgi:hypothetical protein